MALQEIKEEHESGSLSAAPAIKTAAGSQTATTAYIVGLALALAGIAGLLWAVYSRGTAGPGARLPAVTRLTADSGLTLQPSLSPDGKLVAYSSDRAGDGGLDIWVQQLAGGEPIRLTRDPADDQDPSFSPEGTRILFSSGREGGGAYVISALGGSEQKIAEGGFAPRYSPDGKWIAYGTGDRRTGMFVSGAVYVVPGAGGVPRRLGENLTNAAAPTWSPDGRFLLMFGVQRSSSQPVVDWWIAQLDSGEINRTGILDELRSQKLAPPEMNLAT